MREIDSNLGPGSCKFATHSSLFHMSIMANTLAAKKQFGTRKWWVWARRGCTRVFYTIPSFRIDHSQITELFIVNTCHLTSCLWYRPYIIYQLVCTDWNIIILPPWGTAVIQHLDWLSGQSPPALAENNSINSFFNFFLTSADHFVKPQSSRVPWLKGTAVCTPVLSHIIPRTNLFRSLTTIVLLIAQAPAIF